MTLRVFLLLIGIVLGVFLGGVVPQTSRIVGNFAESLGASRSRGVADDASLASSSAKPAASSNTKAANISAGQNQEEPRRTLNLSPSQIAAERIDVAPVGTGILTRQVKVPGTVIPDSSQLIRIAAKVSGTVAEMRKRLGASVAEGEIVAMIESREVADAKSEYLAAKVNYDLQQSVFEREQSLFKKNITAENQFFRARATFTEAQLRLDLGRQKLSALGISEAAIAALPQEHIANLRLHEVRSSISGRVAERKVDVGAPVDALTELFVIADLSKVWVELAVPPNELRLIGERQRVAITSEGADERGEGKIIFISPILTPETRSARVVAEFDNQSGAWRPGMFVTAEIVTDERRVPLLVPRAALQTINGERVVFLRTNDGFQMREVAVGQSDSQATEVTFGLKSGEVIATTNTFVLKAELGRPADPD